MKNTVKILISFLFVLILLGIENHVSANTIKSISMDIAIDDNGDAVVTEIWKCTTNQGTEVYHPYYNLGNSEIMMLSVTDGSTPYTKLNSWNASGTLESKAKKFGINKISNGVELCWGISSYGTHTYTVRYKITNFVSELTDSQMIYWTLIPYDFSNRIGEMYIKIHTNFKIADTIDVWGYGDYGGTAYVYNGYIEMQSNGPLSTSEYMTILVKFPEGTFNLNNKINKNFDYYYKMAEKGATKYTEEDEVRAATNNYMVAVIMTVVINIIIASLIGTKKSKDNKIVKFGTAGKIKKEEIEYFRDIPCEGDLYKAYFIAYQYELLSNKTDILGSIILKWLKEGKIRVEQKETGAIFKKENTVVVLNEIDPKVITDKREQILFYMLKEASKDGYLENKEFEKWCSNSYYRILNWFDLMISREKEELIKEGLIEVEEKTTLMIFHSKKYTATPELKELGMQLAGLKKYLEDYTLIKEREAIEVALFEDYLIYAQMMGIAKKVAKQFKEIYPEIIEQSSYNSYDNITFIHLCSTRGIARANSARSAAVARASSYSSGGGGFSSGGGGGGSFGGGGGRWRFSLKIKNDTSKISIVFLVLFYINMI